MSIASTEVRRRPARRLTLEHILAATPLLAAVVSLAVLYAAEAIAHPSPTLFVDELQWTQLSRSVAEHGYASIRGERAPFESVYVYLVAPAWWLKDTATSYEAVKYLNVLFMISAAFPAYLLARRLVSKPAAVAVAVASISIPPMVYALYVITEPVAYPWAALCAWLIVEALAQRTRGWIAAAVAASLAAPLVRGQLIVIPVAFALSALAVWWRSEHGRRLRGPAWTRGDTAGLVLLAAGAFAVLTRLLLQSRTEWQLAIDTPGRIWLHAVWAAGALTIGLGVLPLVAGVAGLVPRRGERLLPHDRAFIAVTVALVGLLGAYTGIKGAYNEVTFANRIDERNLFYLAPLLLLAAAIALERRRLGLLALLGGTVLAWYVIRSTELQLNYPYFDAPGFSIATLTNRELFWPPETIHRALLVTLGISVAVALAARFARGSALRAGLALVAVAVIGWNLAGQITAAGGANASARTYERNLPQPVDWVNRATGGEAVTYLGQSITTGVGLRTNLLEFWNPAITRVGTLDGSQLFPGPTLLQRVIEADGSVSEQTGTPYVLADSGVEPVGTLVETRGVLRLYRVVGAIRLKDSVQGVDEEAWMGADAAYNRFAGAGRGELVVTLSRTAFCPDRSAAPPGARVTVVVGELVFAERDLLRQPVLGERHRASGTRVVPNCELRELRLPVQAAPFRAEVHVDNTFRPADFGFPDTRTLGVMIAFRFEGEEAS